MATKVQAAVSEGEKESDIPVDLLALGDVGAAASFSLAARLLVRRRESCVSWRGHSQWQTRTVGGRRVLL